MKNTNKKSFLIMALSVILFTGISSYFIERANYIKTDGFSPLKVVFDLPHEKKWDIPPLREKEKKEVDKILQQKFTYLGKGARSFAFLSEDGNSVLKFFKYRYHKPHWTVRYLPAIFPFEYFRQKKIHKVSLDTVLTGYHTAYAVDQQGTGLLYVHLNLSKNHHRPVCITDKAGKTHTIDLNNTRFVVQRRVKELSVILDELMAAGQVNLALKRLFQTLDLYLSHYDMGIFDMGVGITKNNGFIDGKAVHFDVGKMVRDDTIRDPVRKREQIKILIMKIEKWIEKRYPQHLEEMAYALHERYAVL